MQRAVELQVGGQRYRVVSSASPEELERLARVVDDKLVSLVAPGRPMTPQAILLAALALAHDLEEERQRSASLAEDARSAVERLLGRLDETIASVDATVGRPSAVRSDAGRSDGARAQRRGEDPSEP